MIHKPTKWPTIIIALQLLFFSCLLLISQVAIAQHSNGGASQNQSREVNRGREAGFKKKPQKKKKLKIILTEEEKDTLKYMQEKSVRCRRERIPGLKERCGRTYFTEARDSRRKEMNTLARECIKVGAEQLLIMCTKREYHKLPDKLRLYWRYQYGEKFKKREQKLKRALGRGIPNPGSDVGDGSWLSQG